MTSITVVHERFTEPGGSEVVAGHLTSMAAGVGHVRLCAPLADHDVAMGAVGSHPVHTHQIDRLRRRGSGYAHLLPLLPHAFRSYDLSGSDLVVISHHAFAQRVRVPSGVPSVSYVHSPARWMWDTAKRRDEAGPPARQLLEMFAATQRRADRAAAQRIDLLIANSRAVAERISEWWGRDDARVVHPPVETDYFTIDETVAREDFVLYAGRLAPYKRADLVATAARRAGLPLVVAGAGRAEQRCRAAAGPDCQFLGRVSTAQLRDLYRRCRVLVLPGEEDFGIVPVEAAATGAPIVALARGGSRDTVVDGTTGTLVDIDPEHRDAAEAFAEAIRRTWNAPPPPWRCRAHAEQFSVAAFRAGVAAAVADVAAIELEPQTLTGAR